MRTLWMLLISVLVLGLVASGALGSTDADVVVVGAAVPG